MKHKSTHKKSKKLKLNKFYFVLFWVILFIVVISIFLSTNNSQTITKENLPSLIVNGNSMEPLIKNGEVVYYKEKAYSNSSPKINDVILFKDSRNENLILKQIKAVPGDKFEYKNSNIYVNGDLLKNSVGEPYKIKSNMLELYANSYPIIPKDTYLILGDNPRGSRDSSEFGLVSRKDIIAKVIR